MLFPEVERDVRIATRAMSHFEFFSRCYRADCAAVRNLMENWYSSYPDDEKPELKARLIADDINYHSAFWELYLHELLIRLGYSLEVHPALPTDESTRPDFLATSPEGEEVIIEAATAMKKSEEDAATANRKQTVLDTIDRLEHPCFYLWLNEEGAPDTSPPGRKIRDTLERWLNSLDYESCQELVEVGQFDDLPTRTFEEHGWTLEFQAFPKPRKRLSKPSDRIIHLHHSGFHWVDSRTPIRDAIRRKASRYGDVQRPYLIAVNAIGNFINDIDIAEALFGQEVLEVRLGTGLEMHHRLARRPDGAWTSYGGERNTRVSGVLIGQNVSPSSVTSAPLTLYHNPWAQRQYSGSLSVLKQYVPSERRMEEIGGVHPHEILGVDPNWLQNAA